MPDIAGGDCRGCTSLQVSCNSRLCTAGYEIAEVKRFAGLSLPCSRHLHISRGWCHFLMVIVLSLQPWQDSRGETILFPERQLEGRLVPIIGSHLC